LDADYSFTVTGCVINLTCPIWILPPTSPVICKYPSECGEKTFVCISDNYEDVEWFNPNFEVISTNENARIYG